MQIIPRDERGVIGTDLNGHVGVGNRADEGSDGQVWYSR